MGSRNADCHHVIVETIHRSDLPLAHFELLLSLANDVSGSLDIGDVLVRSLRATRRLIDFRGGSIQLIEDGTLAIAVADPAVSPEVAALRLPIGQGLSGRVAATGRAIYSADLDADPRVDTDVRKLGSNQGIRSYFAVPVVAEGQTVGVLQIDSEKPDAFAEEARALVATLAPLMGSAIQNARIFTSEIETHNRLRELDQLRTDFLSIAAHELRTPLTALIGFAELLNAREHETMISEQEIVDRMRKALARLGALVRDLRRLATADSGSLIVDPKPIDVGTVVDIAISEARASRPINVSMSPRLPRAIADAARLADALEALIKNAINFSPEASAIEVRVRADGATLQIEVMDEGKGVAEENADRIFERFAQLEDPHTRAVGGLGIGLPMARTIVEQMGGQLDVIPGPRGHFEIRLSSEGGPDG